MIKKILLAVVILGVIAAAILGYGTYKVADDLIKQKEPQLRQYMQMDRAAQDKYISDNVAELLAGIDLNKDGKPEDKEQLEHFKQANTNPEIKQALTDVGRSFLSTVILTSDSLTKDMSADVKASYQKESDQLEARLDHYSKLLEAAGVKMEK